MILTARPRTVENKAGCTLASAFGLVWLLRIDAYLVIFSSRLMTNRQCTYLARISPDYVWSAAGLQGKSFGREDKSAAMYSAFGWRYLSWP
jgi:hypothetical protein